MKLNRETAGSYSTTLGAKARVPTSALYAGVKGLRHPLVLLILVALFGLGVCAQDQDKDADKSAVSTPAKKLSKKDQKKDDKKEAASDKKDKEERKRRDDCRHFFRAEVSVDWAGSGFGAGNVDCGESEKQV